MIQKCSMLEYKPTDWNTQTYWKKCSTALRLLRKFITGNKRTGSIYTK